MKTTLSCGSGILFFNPKKTPLFAFLITLIFLSTSFSLFAQDPTVTCPADITQTSDAGKTTALVSFDVSETNPQVVYTLLSGAEITSPGVFAVGTTKITKSIVDANGSTVASCSFSVTVVNNDGLSFLNCPGNTTASNTSGACGSTVTFASPILTKPTVSQKKTFEYTGSSTTFRVPAGVTSINVDASGASGGRAYYNGSVYGTPGAGGETIATIAVTPGQDLIINVGGSGQDASAEMGGAGGFNGGGNGVTASTSGGGGGGGASDIRTSGGTLNERIIVAAGGGGASTINSGGDGGGVNGKDGSGGSIPAKAGSSIAGGNGGSFDGTSAGGNGALGIGGNADIALYGGGGGAGYFGGGGGSVGSGAGGSSYAVSNTSGVSLVSGARNGSGLITITYDQTLQVKQTAGLPSGSVFPVGETINTFTATDLNGNTTTCTFKVAVTDNEKPVLTIPSAQTFTTVASTYKIPVLVAADNCGVSTITYQVTGATTRSGSTADASGAFNTGTSVITYTVTDIHGNVQTGTTTVNVTPASTITVTIPDVFAVSPGGKPNTIYIGYGPSYLLLNATVTGGKAPYTFSWTKAGSTFPISWFPSVLAFVPGEYTLTVKDANGVTVASKKQIVTEDVRCGNNNDKVIICKAPKANKQPQSICVAQSAVAAQLEGGANLGSCTTTTTSSASRVAVIEEPADIKDGIKIFSVYPNPTSGNFNVQFDNTKATKAEVVILSQSGIAVQRKMIDLTGSYQKVSFNIGNMASGVYLIKVVTDEGIKTAKILLQK